MNGRKLMEFSALAILATLVACAVLANTVSDADDDQTEQYMTRSGSVEYAVQQVMYLTDPELGLGIEKTFDSITVAVKDKTIRESFVMNEGTVRFTKGSNMIIDGCIFCINGNVSFSGDVNIKFVNGGKLYIGNYPVLDSGSGTVSTINGPSFDIEYSVSNSSKSTEPKNDAEFNFLIDVKNSDTLMIRQNNGKTDVLSIDLTDCGKKNDLYVSATASLDDFVDFINDKYKDKPDDFKPLSSNEILRFIFDKNYRLPTISLSAEISKAEVSFIISNNYDDNGITTSETTNVYFDVEGLSLRADTSDNERSRISATLSCKSLDVSIRYEMKAVREGMTVGTGSYDLSLSTSDVSASVSIGQLVSVNVDVDSFELNCNDNEVSVELSEFKLNGKITSDGLMKIIEMFYEIVLKPTEYCDIVLKAELNEMTADTKIELDAKYVHVAVNTKDPNTGNTNVEIELSNVILTADFPKNHYLVDADLISINVEADMTKYNDEKLHRATINTKIFFEDARIEIDAKATTFDNIVKLVVQIIRLDVNDQTIDSVMDYKKKIDMDIEFKVNSLMISYENIMELCVNASSSTYLEVSRDAGKLITTGTSATVRADTGGINQIELSSKKFELSHTGGEFNDDKEYILEELFVNIDDLYLDLYSSYGHMYKLLVGLYLFAIDEDHQMSGELKTIFVNFLLQDSSETRVDFDMKSIETGTRVLNDKTREIKQTVGFLGAKDSDKKVVSLHLTINFSCNVSIVTIQNTVLRAELLDNGIFDIRDEIYNYCSSFDDINNRVPSYEKGVSIGNGKFVLELETSKGGVEIASLESRTPQEILSRIKSTGSISISSYSEYMKNENYMTCSEQNVSYQQISLNIDGTAGNLWTDINKDNFVDDIIMACSDILKNISIKHIDSSYKQTIILERIPVKSEEYSFYNVRLEFGTDDYSFIAESVNIEINDTGKKMTMESDGNVYFLNNFQLPHGYNIFNNGKVNTVEGNEKKVIVDSFSISDNSVILSGIKNAAVGTILKLTKPKDMTNGNVKFRGWYINDVFVLSSNEEFTKYKPEAGGELTIRYAYGYVLTFDTKGGDPIQSECFEQYDAIDLTKYTPHWDGCEFIEWDTHELLKGDKMPNMDAVITAKWEANMYVATLDMNGGSCKGGISSILYTYGEGADLPKAESMIPYIKDGFTVSFLGWCLSTDTTKTLVTSISKETFGNNTYVAMWEEVPKEFTVVFDPNGGNVDVRTLTFKFGETIDVTGVTATKEGFTFYEWKGLADHPTMPSKDLTLVALWETTIGNGHIVQDADTTSITVGAEVARINASDITNIIEAGGSSIGLKFNDAEIQLSPAALRRLSEDSSSGNLSDVRMSVSIAQNASDSVANRIKEKEKNKDKITDIMATISIDVSCMGSRDGLGNVKVTVPMTGLEDKEYKVFFIANNGVMTAMDTVCENVEGVMMISFTTPHFSDFAILSMKEEAPAEESSMMMIGIIAGAAIALLVAIVAVIKIVKK